MTEWRAVARYEGLYEVSDGGQVRSLPRLVWHPVSKSTRLPGKQLKPVEHSHGYREVTLWRGGVPDRRYVHRLVLDAFVGPHPDLEACHINGTPDDNRLENLRWGTRTDNSLDSVRHGTHNRARNMECPQGHPYDLVNTIVLPSGARRCRECSRLRSDTYRRTGSMSESRECEECGTGYIARRPWTKFCSSRCRGIVGRRMRRLQNV